MHSTRPALRGSGALLIAVLFGLAGCALPPPGSGGDPRWPYPGIRVTDRAPDALAGYAQFEGRWMEAMPEGETALVEATLPQFLLGVPFGQYGGWTYFDLGPGAEAENVAFAPRQDRMFLVAAVSSPHHTGNPVFARALLEVDMDGWTLLGAIPLSRDAINRGIVLDPNLRRAYLLEETGGETGVLETVDLYEGRVVARRPVGHLPIGVWRKGLALDRDGRVLYCLVGGDGGRDDFAPLDEGPSTPRVLALDADSLTVRGAVELSDRYEPRALRYDEPHEKLAVLLSNYERSAVAMVDAGFLTVRVTVDLPEPTTDLTLSNGYAFAPGARGIYIVDLDAETWISRPGVGFEQTGEISVSGDLTVALVRFSAQVEGSAAGLAVVDLAGGGVREILQ